MFKVAENPNMYRARVHMFFYFFYIDIILLGGEVRLSHTIAV